MPFAGRVTPLVAGLVALAALAACSSAHPARAATSPSSVTPTTVTPTTTTPSTVTPTTTLPAHEPSTSTSTGPSAIPRATPTPAGRRPVGHAAAHRSAEPLPLPYATHDARQIVTVIAASHDATTAILQTWTRVAGGWRQVGHPVTADVGADGIGHASEATSATPEGSYTLTQAFGHDANPGTRLPYTHTNPSDWWISQEGPLYNTLQSCTSACAFRQGSPNEHLYDEMPYYTYAAVIDYNTRNAPGGVKAGAGSAFFLHETVGQPTAGCVAIPRKRLVSVLRWLRPVDHPRIVIGIS